LWIPLVGKILEKSIVARTMRTLGTLIASGVPILEALAIVRETSSNVVFERCFTRVIESIREGDTIADPLKQSRLVDDMVTNMIEVGEETGDLDTMLFKIADFYDEEVDTAVKGLISALEPLMIVVLGLIIGAIVFSLTAAAVVKALGKGDEVRTRNELSQLASAVQAFKTQYQVEYMADQIVLPPGYDAATTQYFKRLWPRLSPSTLGQGTTPFT